MFFFYTLIAHNDQQRYTQKRSCLGSENVCLWCYMFSLCCVLIRGNCGILEPGSFPCNFTFFTDTVQIQEMQINQPKVYLGKQLPKTLQIKLSMWSNTT